MIIISVITFAYYCYCYFDYIIAIINCLEKRRRKIKNKNNIPSTPPDLVRNKELKRNYGEVS